MRNAIIGICLLVSSACLADDPISNLTQRLNSEIGGMWMNGEYPRVNLPSNSTPTQVVTRAAQAWGITTGTNDTLRIIEIRTVQLSGSSGSPWMAALIECGSGKKILLFCYDGHDYMWSRFYDVKDEGSNKVPENIGAKAPSSSSSLQVEQDVTVVGNTIWKKAPNGLAIGISHAGDLAINIYFANQGTNDITGLIQSTARFILELNGKYYAMADYGGKASFMPPGRTYGPITIDMPEFSEIPKLTPNYVLEPNDSHPVFQKGSNMLRVYYKIDQILIPSTATTLFCNIMAE